MKRICIILILTLVMITGVFAMSFEAGITYMQPASLDTIIESLREKDLSLFLNGHEVAVSGRLSDMFLDAGVEAGVQLYKVRNWSPIPFVRAFAGMKVRMYEYFGISGGAGYQMRLLLDDKSFEGTLFWRFAGNMLVGPISIEGVVMLPVPTDQGIANVFNLGNAAHDAKFGFSVTYML